MRQGLRGVIRRELSRMTRRPMYLVITLIIPILIILFFATFFYQGMPQQMPIAVLDFDNTSTSRNIVRNLDAGQMCDIKFRLTSYESAISRMQRGEIYAFVLIPRGFEQDVYSGRQPVINFHTEYSHYLGSSLIMKELQTTLTTLSIGADLKVRLQKGENPIQAMAQVNAIATDGHIIGNSMLNYSLYLTSLLMPGIIFMMAMMCSVYAIGTELKNGSSRRWLVTSKRNIWVAVIGKMLPYTALFSLMTIVSEIIMEKILGFPSYGNPVYLYVGAVLTVLAYQGIGVFLIGMLPSMRVALSISAFYGTMGFTLSGFTYPNIMMYAPIRVYSYFYPLKQYYNLYCNIQINGLGFVDCLLPMGILLLFCIVLPWFSIYNLRSAAIKLNYKRD